MEKKNRQPLKAPLFNSNYIIDKFIGAGGMSSEVYLVHKKDNTEQIYAAKVVYFEGAYTKDFVKRFGDEAITSLRVWNKKNLVQTHEVFPTANDEALVFIMDYIDGISLNKYMNQQGCLGPKAALSIFKKILIGVKELHSFNRQIIHRDLKPDNVLLSKDLSKVTLIDFGIATVVERAKDYLDKSNIKIYTNDDKVLWGTGPYVIPDALDTNNAPSVQYDFFSLGVILYKMLMGKLPFDLQECNGNQTAIVKLPLQYDIANISSNPTISPSLENIIFRCMACKKEDLKYRYNDIQEIIDDVNKVNLSKKDETPLLKPVNKRMYQQAHLFNQDVIRSNQKFYKRWWFFFTIMGILIAILITFIVVFFVI